MTQREKAIFVAAFVFAITRVANDGMERAAEAAGAIAEAFGVRDSPAFKRITDETISDLERHGLVSREQGQ